MTIGIGFLCEDGIVLCADNQITWPGSHKYYECKLYPHSMAGWLVVMTFSGSPELMKSFNGKFRDSMALMAAPHTAIKIQDNVETILSVYDVLISDPMQLNLLCGIVIPGKEFKLLKTEGQIVREVSRFEYVGVGDSSVLRYLSPLLTQTRGYTISQAFNLGTYLTLQARRYVEGCGGDTDAVVLKSDGRLTNLRGPHHVEQKLLLLEHFLNRAATDFFDDRSTEEEFKNGVEGLSKALIDYRPQLMR